QAAQAMDDAAASFADVPVRAFPYYVRGAEARLAAGDPAGALARLTVAMRLLEQRRESIRIEPRRAAVFAAARTVVDRIVMLQLADGRERGAAAGGTAPGPDHLAAPPGEVVVEYALVNDTLLAWTVSGTRVEVARTTVNAAQLERTLEETEAKLQRRAPVGELQPLLATLYDRLLRPLDGRLGAPGTRLVIVTDGAIAAVPFAALYDARRGRYLVEDRTLRYAVSLREAWRSPVADAGSGVLLVADPAFDRRRHPLLDRLPHALDEARGLAAGYRDARTLEGERATPQALATALPRAGIAHFAGHAVFDDEHPERSYLLLAPGEASQGTMTAEELARMDLHRVRLVVLAACRTVRSGRGRAAGFTGLSGALLAAGAGGTVGSTWDVDDRLTSVLMAEFHRRYPDTHDAPGSLRDAQLSLLRSETPALRSPAAWAGFRYAGR
ncbi:MAG TPA: CHAT domain-containing protein, partial [Longimicrobium sp.]|nr:CHAT domain-containing protein [Longimicrobium sp.]